MRVDPGLIWLLLNDYSYLNDLNFFLLRGVVPAVGEVVLGRHDEDEVLDVRPAVSPSQSCPIEIQRRRNLRTNSGTGDKNTTSCCPVWSWDGFMVGAATPLDVDGEDEYE
jgi:hypothetical protein